MTVDAFTAPAADAFAGGLATPANEPASVSGLNIQSLNASPRMKKTLKAVLRRFVPASVLENRRRLAVLDLMESNLRIGLPNEIKHLFVRNAAAVLGYPTFIETGTFEGDMTALAAGLFREVHSIELQPELAARARERFVSQDHVRVHQGDSGGVLRELLKQVDTSCVFWLDAHYSGGITARGERDTPVIEELRAIAAHPVRPHAVFIDDARVFGMDDDYPSLEETIRLLKEIDPELRVGVCADIIWASRVKLVDFQWRETETGVVEIAGD
jgi:hypothetical protein